MRNIPDCIVQDSAEGKESTEAYLVLKEVFYNQIKVGRKTVEY